MKRERKEQLVMTHETVRPMTDGQRSDLITTVVGAIPSNLSFEEAQAIIGEKGPLVAEIRKAFAKRRLNAIPADEEWFDLEVDYDVDPMDVVTSAGYNPSGWKYLGPQLSGKRTLQVKLVRLGYVRNLEEARKRADELGYRLVEGPGARALQGQVPQARRQGAVAFGGSEWQNPDGRAHVTYLIDFEVAWDSPFLWSDGDFRGDWRWLVAGK